jgi:glycerol-3-phosphate acyltransferase PlsY
MDFTPYVLCTSAYLCGSIPFGLLIGKAKGVDVRTVGSGNIGATNIGRIFGRKYFFICFTLDFAKGLLPVLAAGHHLGALGKWDVEPRIALMWLATVLSAVAGHIFSPWLKFKGGKGVATSLGALLGVFPVLSVAAGGAFLAFILTLKVGGFMSLASIAGACALPIAVACTMLVRGERLSEPRTWPFLALAFILAILVTLKHRANIARIRAGTEPKFGAGSRSKPNR